MNAVSIDFNDEVYRATGIREGSVSLKDAPFENGDGRRYRVQVVKVHTGDAESLFISLKNGWGRAVEDLAVRTKDRSLFCRDASRSQDAVVLDGFDRETVEDMELSSESESVSLRLRVGLEPSARELARPAAALFLVLLMAAACPKAKWRARSLGGEDEGGEEGDWVPGWLRLEGRRIGDRTALLDPSAPPSEEAARLFGKIEAAEQDYRATILGEEPDGSWTVLEEGRLLDEALLEVEDVARQRFVVVVDPGKKALKKSVSTLLEVLGSGRGEGRRVEPSSAVLFVEVPEDAEAGR